MGALNALFERAKAKLAADEGLERATYVIPLVCERAKRESVHPGDVSFLVYELLELTVRRDGIDLEVKHTPHALVTLDTDLAPLVASAREELAPPSWDGASDTPCYVDETRRRIEEKARKLLEACDDQLSMPPASRAT